VYQNFAPPYPESTRSQILDTELQIPSDASDDLFRAKDRRTPFDKNLENNDQNEAQELLVQALKILNSSVDAMNESLNMVRTAFDKVMNCVQSLAGWNDNSVYGQHLSGLVGFLSNSNLKTTWTSFDHSWSKFSTTIQALTLGSKAWANFPGFGGLL